jgi:hypothetical protein
MSIRTEDHRALNTSQAGQVPTQDDGSACDLAHHVPYLTEERLLWTRLEIDLVAIAGPAYQASCFQPGEFARCGTGASPNRTCDASQVNATVGRIHDQCEHALTDLRPAEQKGAVSVLSHEYVCTQY